MEELNTALAQLIEQASAGIDASVGFLEAELPDVVYQLILWYGIKNAILCIASILLLLVPFLVVRRLRAGFKKYSPDKKKSDYEDGEAISEWTYADITTYSNSPNSVYIREKDVATVYQVVGGALSLASLFLSAAFFNLTWLQIWIAPKVWLLEYAAQLVT